MFRPTRKNLLLTAIIATGLPFTASANEQQLDTVRVTSAAGFEQNIADAPASISVLTAEDLQAKQFRDLAEALADVEGVDVRSGTGKTGGLDISIRGLPSDYTLILIDGRRQNIAGDVTPNGFGAALTSFMPPLSAIERIEVIRGPMSTLYGSDAVGGVVNIITKKVASEWTGNIRQETGLPESKAWGTQQKTDLYTTGPLVEGLLGFALRASTMHREASDWILAPGATQSGRNPAPAETRQYNMGARLSLTPNSNHELYFDIDRETTWYNNEDGRLGNRDQTIIDNQTGNLPGYKDHLGFNRNQLALVHTGRFSQGILDSSITYTTTETDGRTVPGKYADIGNPYVGYPSIIVGKDRKLETTNTVVDSKFVTSLIDQNTTTVGAQIWNAELEDSLIPSNLKQTMLAAFVENEWYITNSLALTLGGRYDHHDEFGGNFSPRAYLVFNALDELTVKGGINQGFRAPKLNQLADGISGISGQGTTINIGNPNLKPETSTNTELGVLFNNNSGISASVTLFHNVVKDRISSGGDCSVDWISSCNANSTATYSINIDEATTYGAEASAKIALPANLSLSASYTWTDSEVKKDGKKDGKLGNIPEHIASSTLNWAANEKLNLWLRGNYRGEARRFTGDYAKLTGNNKLINDTIGDIKEYVLFDLGAGYKATNHVSINATVTNLLDKDFAKFKTYTDTNSNTAYVGEYFQSSRSVTGGVIPSRTYWLSMNVSF
ncbi:MAG: TonB-dependent receptor [Venatoribacter sp.]